MSHTAHPLHAALADLSEEQRAVVMAPPGPLLVLAGAGSGKTRALTQRVAYFLHHGVASERILLVTFTNQAARQMIARLSAQAPRAIDGLWAGTFHHLAVRVLRQHGFLIGLSPRFVVLDRHDATDLLSSCLSESRLPPGCTWPRATFLQSLFSLSINAEKPLLQVLLEQAPEFAEIATDLSRVCDRYTLRKLEMGLCDFDDLLLGWRLLLCDHPALREQQREQFQHLFIDEYQDTSRVQSAIVEDIAQGYRSLTVVGDDGQSIYRFRGAALSNLQEFRARWPDARVLHLSTNYRSQPAIVALSNHSIARNAAGVLVARKPMRAAAQELDLPPRPLALPGVVALPDARLQAAFVAQRIRERLAEGHAPTDIAVLYRSHRHARELQIELLRCGIPYVLRSGPRMSQQAHIKDALGFLRLCHNPADRLAWARVLRQISGLGDTGRGRVLQALDDQLRRGGAVAELPDLNDRVLQHARGDSRRSLFRMFALLAELRELLRAAQASADTVEALPGKLLHYVLDRHYRDYAKRAFVDAAQRIADLEGLCGQSGKAAAKAQTQASLGLDAKDGLRDFLFEHLGDEDTENAAAAGHVVLSTIHQAKGLEWRVVFLLWLCEGHFPAAAALAALDGNEQEQEERRLFYVAVTRARAELYLCYPAAAAAHGALRRSRFLDELEQSSVHTPLFERWAVRTDQFAPPA